MQPHLLLFTLSLLLLLLHYRATASVLPSSSDDITSSNNRDFNSDNFINSSPETSQFEVADLLFDGPKPSIIDNVRGGLGAGARPALEILRQGLDIDNPGEIILPTEKKSDEPARTSGRKELASTDDFCPYHMFGLRKVAVCDSGKVLDVQFNLALKYWTLTAATLMWVPVMCPASTLQVFWCCRQFGTFYNIGPFAQDCLPLDHLNPLLQPLLRPGIPGTTSPNGQSQELPGGN